MADRWNNSFTFAYQKAVWKVDGETLLIYLVSEVIYCWLTADHKLLVI